MAAQDAHHAGDIVVGVEEDDDAAAQFNRLLRDIARDVGARADALEKRLDELDGEFEARAAAGDDDDSDLRARLAELSRMGEELYVEFETRLMDLDAMVLRRLAEIRAEGEGAAASEVEEDEVSCADAAELFEEDGSD